jgi:hypothetical protein
MIVSADTPVVERKLVHQITTSTFLEGLIKSWLGKWIQCALYKWDSS